MSEALLEHPTIAALNDGTAISAGVCWNLQGGKFVLPAQTLGYQAIAWAQKYLRMAGGPLTLTPEQKRFILWWYAIDDEGRFSYRNGALQRLKGAG